MRRAESQIETYVPEYNWGDDIDLIVLAGSPWLGINPGDIKLRMLKQAIKRWPEARRIALGIGSFYRYSNIKRGNYGDGKIEKDADAYEVARNLSDFHLVLVRDAFGKEILDKVGVDAELYFDTSIFSYFKLKGSSIKSREKSILVYTDPLKGDVWDHLPEYIWEEYIRYQIDWASNSDAEVLVISSADKSSAMEHDLNAKFVTDVEWLAARYSSASNMLSPRVHQCILAKIMGCGNVRVMPLDSRYTTAINVGIGVSQPNIRGKIENLEDGRIEGIVDDKTEYLFPRYEYRVLDFNRKRLKNGIYLKKIVKLLRAL